ncbi:MAG: hypothetical protein JJU48_00105 [Methylophaga sp.]|nr:hypothetical protein [Methylophaga sp.]
MHDWLPSLLLWIVAVTAYDDPPQLPEIIPISQQQLIEILCHGENCPALAYYDPGSQTIFHDQRLDFDADLNARSFLVHELVHYLQDKQGLIDISSMSCEQRMLLEREAYLVQGKFLHQHGLPARQITLALSILEQVCDE